jgi:two-component system response regulator YesN
MYNVLVVDDEDLILEGMTLLVDWQAWGFRIAATADDGLSALEILRTQPIDLVLTDIRMPEMNGIELIAAIRERLGDTKIVILSGYGDFPYAQKAIQYGVTRYLLKPVEVEELTECLVDLRRELDKHKVETPTQGQGQKKGDMQQPAQGQGDMQQPAEKGPGPNLHRDEETVANTAMAVKDKEPHVIDAIQAFIGEHYADNLSLKQIAGLYYMNTAYLGQLFKQKTGQTFNDYLNQTRIAAIKKEMLHHCYTGAQSIHRAGFKSVEHFYKQFRRYEGTAFSQYKERIQHIKEEE